MYGNICWVDINIINLKGGGGGGGVVTLPFVPVFIIISRNIIYLNNTIGQFQGMF